MAAITKRPRAQPKVMPMVLAFAEAEAAGCARRGAGRRGAGRAPTGRSLPAGNRVEARARPDRACRDAGAARRRRRAWARAARRLRPLRDAGALPDVRRGDLARPHPPALFRRLRPEDGRGRARAAYLRPADLPPSARRSMAASTSAAPRRCCARSFKRDGNLTGRIRLILAVLAVAWPLALARADEPPTITVTIKDHRFFPAEIHVPQGKPVILKITNEDPTPEEFELDRVEGREGDRRRNLRHGSSAPARCRALSVHGRIPFRYRPGRDHF